MPSSLYNLASKQIEVIVKPTFIEYRYRNGERLLRVTRENGHRRIEQFGNLNRTVSEAEDLALIIMHAIQLGNEYLRTTSEMKKLEIILITDWERIQHEVSTGKCEVTWSFKRVLSIKKCTIVSYEIFYIDNDGNAKKAKVGPSTQLFVHRE